MSHFDQFFSDFFAQKKNWLTQIDARIKLVFATLALLINLSAPKPWVPVLIVVLSLVMLASVRVPLKLVIIRLTAPLGIAIFVWFTQIFWYGHTPAFVLPILGLHLTGYKEGLAHGFLIFSRALGGVAIILWLGFVTSFSELLAAAGWFKIPATLVEVAALVYRYLFVLMDEVTRIRQAQILRLGYGSWHNGVKATGTLLGMLLIRSYDRSKTVAEAMVLRGYKGTRQANSKGNS
jgi:cobalt/nickel transport system permease protein